MSDLNLRDHFAGQAMQAIVTGDSTRVRAGKIDEMAMEAYALADAMLRARAVAHGEVRGIAPSTRPPAPLPDDLYRK